MRLRRHLKVTMALLVLLLITTHCSAASTHRRHLLHQPFFPADSTLPPTQPPQPQPQPKLPFSSSSSSSVSPDTPFFPSYRTPSPPPPPPSPTALTSFPANISSLLLPHTSSHSSHKLLAVIVSASLASAAVIAAVSALFLYFRRRREHFPVGAEQVDKASRSDSHRLFPPNTVTSDGSKSHATTPNHSSEFLYLGTLVNSRSTVKAANSSTAGFSASPYRKLGSPELNPLPPLPKHNTRHSCQHDDAEDDEQFFSPRGSGGSPGSNSRKLETDGAKLGKTDANLRALWSKSSSPTTSLSSVKTRSPDSIINFMNLSRPLPTPPSPSLSLSPETEIPSDVSQQFVAARIPPPLPPPLPPVRFWEQPAPALRPTVGPQNSEAGLVDLAPEQSPVIGAGNSENAGDERNPSRPKLKALHWDKVRTSSDRAMVWDHLKSSSFQLNEEMIESLFTANNSAAAGKDNGRRQILFSDVPENRVLDPKKSQNIAILLRALNITADEVCEGLLEGNSDTLGTELLESLLKMAPTKEEEWKLRDYKDDSPLKLGPAEKFLKAVLDIPFAFKRVDALLYIANFDSEVDYLRRSFSTLELACAELKNSRMFTKLLEAVLKTGNRMNVGTNRGDARAFKLDTLLKLVDVKGADGKTTLLHFVVHEIIRAEGLRLSGANPDETADVKDHQPSYRDDVEYRKLGLQVVSGLSGELSNVKKAAAMDSDVLSNEVAKLGGGISKIVQVLKSNEEAARKESSGRFAESMNEFLKRAEQEVERLEAQEKGAICLLKEITEYYHGNSAKEEAHRLRIFMVVRDFLSVLEQVCKEVCKVNERSTVGLASARHFPAPTVPMPPSIFPGLSLDGNQLYGSSDEATSSSS